MKKIEEKKTLIGRFKGLTDKKSVESNSVETEKKFLNCEDVMKLTQTKKSKSYEIIKQCNEELKKLGIITISGKVPYNYFVERMGLTQMV